MNNSSTVLYPPHERTCRTPRSYVSLLLGLIAIARHDPDVRRLLPQARHLLFDATEPAWGETA